jgi:hypothetical protein
VYKTQQVLPPLCIFRFGHVNKTDTLTRRRIAISLGLSYVLYLIIATSLEFVGLKGIAIYLWYVIPFVTMWLSYGVSPTCLPMVPTCVLSDIIESVQVVIPAKIMWPDALQLYPGCLGPPWYNPNATIVVPSDFSNITRGMFSYSRVSSGSDY